MRGDFQNYTHRYDSYPSIYTTQNNFNFEQCNSWEEVFPTITQRNSMLKYLIGGASLFSPLVGLSLAAVSFILESCDEKVPGLKKQQPKYHQKIWSVNDELTYCFLDDPKNRGDENKKNAVAKGFKTWEQIGIALSFKKVSKMKDAVFRIGFEKGGSYSYVGTDCQEVKSDQKTMNFGWDIVNDGGTVLHQIGHALGLYHEHQIPICPLIFNQQRVIQQFSSPPNNWEQDSIRSNILDRLQQGTVFTTVWDPKSIMHYDFKARLIQGPSHLKKDIPMNRVLSKKDKQYIRGLYPLNEQQEPQTSIIQKIVKNLSKIGSNKQEEQKPSLYCRQQHKMAFKETNNRGISCDICKQEIERGQNRYNCKECDFDVCVNCSEQHQEQLSSKRQGRNQKNIKKTQLQKPNRSESDEQDEQIPTLYCSQQHKMSFKETAHRGISCDICEQEIEKRQNRYTCKKCDFDICVNCSEQYHSNYE